MTSFSFLLCILQGVNFGGRSIGDLLAGFDKSSNKNDLSVGIVNLWIWVSLKLLGYN